MKKTLRLLHISTLLFTITVNAQDYKRTFNWYFGDSAGLSFATNPPTALTNGSIGKTEGCATVSDTNGQLLFYTNGVNVWNKNHQVMQNGTGLKGHISSTQSSIIIPYPSNDSLFYIFTTDAVGDVNGLQYSVVNINSNGGLGSVVQKNILLQTPVCEKLAATKHQNGRDVWVLAHGFGDNNFYAYQVTEGGLINCPVITSIGSIHYNNLVTNAAGAMKFSIDGTRLGVCVYDPNNSKIDLFKFETSSGKILSYIPINNILLPYGIEFSKNVRYIYASTRMNELVTYDITSVNSSDIELSKMTLADYNNSPIITGALQLGVDSKIHVIFPDSLFLGVINYPDSGGAKSGYSPSDIQMSGKKTSLGLPNFLSSYFYRPQLDFTYIISCTERNKGDFILKSDSVINTTNWQIKRIATNTAIANFSSFAVSYIFPDSGLYEVRLIANSDTVIKTIFIDAPILPMTDTLGCGVDSVVLMVPNTYRCLQWGDTSFSAYSRSIKANGIYYVQGYDSRGCLITDSVKIRFSPSPLQPNITKINDSLQSSPAFLYQWLLNDTLLAGANTQSIKPAKAGLYKVFITDSNGCSNMSTPYSSNVGILNPVVSDNIRIYPNPTNDKLNVESDNKIAEVKIYDVTGRMVYEQSTISDSSLQINCNKFIRGIYFIKINSNLNTYYSHKIIIQ
ncbi:MAG: T9SS type A sorting domain-containing protein, partial [Bacteroidia bacterium]|nr:T9SS type A sorting domain-containing protein [Bacteroidia bacterium]